MYNMPLIHLTTVKQCPYLLNPLPKCTSNNSTKKRLFSLNILQNNIESFFLVIARIVKSYRDLQPMYSFYLSPLACIISQSPYSVYVVSSSHYIF